MKKKNGGFDCHSQNRRLAYFILFWRIDIQPPQQRFFSFPLMQWVDLPYFVVFTSGKVERS
ncbi:MAG: hypothetical protein RR365_12865 [Bacteroides sp.]